METEVSSTFSMPSTSTLVCAGTTLVLVGGITFWLNSKINALDTKVTTLEAKLSSVGVSVTPQVNKVVGSKDHTQDIQKLLQLIERNRREIVTLNERIQLLEGVRDGTRRRNKSGRDRRPKNTSEVPPLYRPDLSEAKVRVDTQTRELSDDDLDELLYKELSGEDSPTPPKEYENNQVSELDLIPVSEPELIPNVDDEDVSEVNTHETSKREANEVHFKKTTSQQ